MPENDTPPDASLAISPPPSPFVLFGAFFAIGLQSFGGGQATAALIRRTVVERHGWMEELEYARFNALCQLAPGMNLIALPALLGRRLCGGSGVPAALLGLLLPSIALTILFAALFRSIGRGPLVEAALQGGVVPATVGLGAYSSWRNLRALFDAAHKTGGRVQVVLSALLCAGSAAAAIWAMGGRAPVFLILGVSGLVAAGWGTLRPEKTKIEESEEEPVA